MDSKFGINKLILFRFLIFFYIKAIVSGRIYISLNETDFTLVLTISMRVPEGNTPC